MSRAAAHLTSKRVLEKYRQSGEDFLHEQGLSHKKITEGSRHRFEQAILRTFWSPVQQYIDTQSTRDVADALGINYSAIYRWGKDNGRAVKLRNFSLLSVMSDNDFNLYPTSREIVLQAYREAFEYIHKEALGYRRQASITDEEICCLFCVCRSTDWLQACGEYDLRLLHKAVADISQFVANELCDLEAGRNHWQATSPLPKTSISSPEDIDAILQRRLIAWQILETSIRYDWLIPED